MPPAKKPAAAKKPSAKSTSKATGSKAATSTKQKATGAADKYTKPELREHIKQEVLQGDKGGRAGQWSARKAQMVAHEYEA